MSHLKYCPWYWEEQTQGPLIAGNLSNTCAGWLYVLSTTFDITFNHWSQHSIIKVLSSLINLASWNKRECVLQFLPDVMQTKNWQLWHVRNTWYTEHIDQTDQILILAYNDNWPETTQARTMFDSSVLLRQLKKSSTFLILLIYLNVIYN